LLQATNRLAEAEPLMRRALAINENSFGVDHPNVATALNNLAQLLQATNRLAEAEPLMRRALAIRERSLVPDHPDIANSLTALAALLETTERSQEAALLRIHALEMQERTLGPDHPDTLRGWNQLSHALRKRGIADQAEPIDRRVAATTTKILGATHPLSVHLRNNLALTLIMLGKLEEARQILAANWRLNAPPHANTTPRIAFLRHTITLLESQPNTPFLGQLKTLLTGPELPVASDVAVPWDMAYFLEFLNPKLGGQNAEFLTALVAALNDRAKFPDLDQFQEWREQPLVSLEVPWPD
jgi:tetratricopeptide (TPR) repeat protein